MSKYIHFGVIEEKPKTTVYGVFSKSSGDKLGEVRWYAPWRQYSFKTMNDPRYETWFNPDCLDYITYFIRELMKQRKLHRSLSEKAKVKE